MAFITRIADYIVENYDLTKDFLTVIFPNKRAALTLRKELSRRTKKNIWFPQIMSIQEAMTSWSGIQLVDNVDVIYELIRIMNNSLELSARNYVFGLASQIVKDFDEIDQYAVDAPKLFGYLNEAKALESWSPDKNSLTETESSYLKFFASLNSYYDKLRTILLENNCGYYGLITRKLYELSNAELESIIGNSKIVFAGFNAMTLTEESIITRLAELNKAAILWDLDKYYYEDEKQEAGLFARQFFSKHRNHKIDNLGDNFNNKKINLISVSGSSVQAEALQLNLEKMQTDGHKLRNTAVVLADETLLIPVLNSIPENYDDISVTMGYPYSKTIVNHFIRHLFSFHTNDDKGIYLWSLKRLLETEIVKVIFDTKEQFLLQSCIDSFLKKSVYYVTLEELDEFCKNEKIIRFINTITKKWESANDCTSTIKTLLVLIDDYLSGSRNNFIRNQISVAGRIINKIDRLINKYDVIVQFADIETLYNKSASEMSIKLNRDSQTDVESTLQIMGLLETRNLDFDVVHILSVNEGILPQSKGFNTLIPHDLRLIYQMPTHTNKQAVYAYHFYRLIQNAKEINIYYNTLADGMGEGEPSRFIQQIINELPNDSNNIDINNIMYKSPSPKLVETIDLVVDKTDKVLEKIKNKISGVNRYGTRKGLSPTSISTYLKCPMQFYLKYIENVSDNTPDESIQANVIGNIVHSTFEFLYKHFDKGIITSEYYDEIVKKYYNEAFNHALVENNFPKGLPETGFNYLSQIMIEEITRNFIDYEREYLKKGNELTIIGLEENLTYTFDIDGTEVNLTGFADRIDFANDKVRIIDYKSGQVKDDDVLIKDTSENLSDLTEKSLQLTIYKYLYKKNNTEVNIEDIEPAIYGLLKVSNPFFPLKNCSDAFDNDTLMDTCDIQFEELFREILDVNKPFVQVADETKCNNCDFMTICKRIPKKY